MKKFLNAVLVISLLSLTAACSSDEPGFLNAGPVITDAPTETGNPIFTNEDDPIEEEEIELLALWPLQVGESSEDFANAVVIDAEGNVYVVGHTNGNLDPERPRQSLPGNINHDVLIFKYDSLGRELWRRQAGGRGDDLATAASLDSEGNLYIAGTTTDDFEGRSFAGGRADVFIQKYSPEGSLLWTSGLNTATTDELIAIEHFKESLIVLVNSLSDITLMRLDERTGGYDPRVDLLEHAGSSSADTVTNLTLDHGTGEIYVVGWTPGEFPWYVNGRAQDSNGAARFWQNSNGDDGFVMRLDADFFVTETVTIPTTKMTRIYDVALDDDRNLYLVGETTDDDLSNPANTRPATNGQSFTLKLNENFGREWLRQNGRNLHELAYRVDLAPNGDVLVAGYESDALNSDVSVTRYSAEAGLEIFNRPFGSPVADNIRDLAIDADGTAYLVGATQGLFVGTERAETASDNDVFVIRVDANGDLI